MPGNLNYSTNLQKIQLKIAKSTTDQSFERIKSDLIKDGVDFSYTIVRNSSKEIIAVSLQISGKGTNGENFNGSYNTSPNSPIKPITILYDDKGNAISFCSGNAKEHSQDQSAYNIAIGWSNTHRDKKSEKEVIVNEKNGKRTTTVFHSFFADDEKSDAGIYSDGKKATKTQIDTLAPESIKSMQVTKGKEGEGDVIHVTTKTNTTNSDKKPLIKKQRINISAHTL